VQEAIILSVKIIQYLNSQRLNKIMKWINGILEEKGRGLFMIFFLDIFKREDTLGKKRDNITNQGSRGFNIGRTIEPICKNCRITGGLLSLQFATSSKKRLVT